jgi:branched-chain amino acid transport system substrate-binding protein
MVAGYAVHPDVTKAGESNFRNGYLGTVEGAAAAELAVKTLKAKRIAVLSMDNDYGRELGDGFKGRAQKLGATVVSYQAYKFPGEREFRPFLTRVKEANPDLLFACGYYNEGALFTRQAQELGLKVPIVGTEGMDSPKFLELAGAAAEGLMITTNLDRDDSRPLVQNFLKNYRQAYGIDADMVGASSFDAFKILVAAIDKAGTDQKAITKALMETRDYNGLTGKISRFIKGEAIKPVQIQVVKGGKFRRHSVIDNPEVITPVQ